MCGCAGDLKVQIRMLTDNTCLCDDCKIIVRVVDSCMSLHKQVGKKSQNQPKGAARPRSMSQLKIMQV